MGQFWLCYSEKTGFSRVMICWGQSCFPIYEFIIAAIFKMAEPAGSAFFCYQLSVRERGFK